MGRKSSVTNVELSRMLSSKNTTITIGICCFVFTIIFYFATHLQTFWSFGSECALAAESIGQYQQYLLWTLQAPSKVDLLQPPEISPEAVQVKELKNPKSAKEPVPKIPSRAAQVAHDATIKLQYAVNSSKVAKIEGPNLLGMGKHITTFTRLLEAILMDTTIDRRPFLDLRDRYFGWWKPSNITHLPWDHKSHSTGIVLTAGQGNMALAAHAIRAVRNVVKSELPIQLAYAGDDDLPKSKRRIMQSLDPKLELINVVDHYDEGVAGLSGGGYAMKPFAALASRFEKVIIIDADTIFMQRPEDWFEWNMDLKRTGTLFFHDRAIGGGTTDWIKEVLGESSREPSVTLNTSMYWQEQLGHQQESGVVYFNKAIPGAFMSLLFSTYMNTQPVRAQLYGHIFGDKETFWLAAELAGIPYAFHPTYAGIIGPITANAEGVPEICAPQPLQTDLDGRPFWFNSGLMQDKTNSENKDYANLTHFIPGRSHEQPIGGWRFIHDHTFCMGRSTEEMKSIKEAGLEVVAKNLIDEAIAVDDMLEIELAKGPL